MTDPNYQKHFKVLGKIARVWDDGGLDVPSMQLLAARFFDQIATGEAPSYGTTLLLNPFATALDASMQVGANAVQNIAAQMAAAYLTAADFLADLTTTPSNTSQAAKVLEALQTEMGAGEDNVTLTDKAATGLVNFFDSGWSPTLGWNTASDATATYKDSIYVVTTIV